MFTILPFFYVFLLLTYSIWMPIVVMYAVLKAAANISQYTFKHNRFVIENT